MTYGKRLDQALDYAKKSRKELAHHLGCAPQTIGIVITGAGKAERKLSTDNHSKAVEFLRINGEWLLTGAGEMLPATATVNLTAPSPTLVATGSASNQAVALIQQAQTAINVEYLPVELQVICNAFSKLPDDNRTKALADILQIITQAQGPPSNQGLPAYSHAATRAA